MPTGRVLETEWIGFRQFPLTCVVFWEALKIFYISIDGATGVGY